ncbi:MAG: YihA family ribosome biogenesis GTP-binding protein [Pseudomonadales bacterium]|nr:YihA family ribosome biogenesis GTP-binding protein [Pseudomonadales bacterium]
MIVRPMTRLLHTTTFMTSAAKTSQCPPDQGHEVAFAGRSNAGKSSALNALTQQRQLARSSKTPGRTQLINFFTVSTEETRLVDLPGYGYAAVSASLKANWQRELQDYLMQRRSLAGLILLMDIRHPCRDSDIMLLDWARTRALPMHILLTKADKLNRGPAISALNQVQRQLKTENYEASIQLFSATQGTGLEACENLLQTWLGISFPISTVTDTPGSIPQDSNSNEQITR